MNILITGTSSGIGEALARSYLEENHSVWGISRNPNTHLEKFDQFHFKSIDLQETDRIEGELDDFLKDLESLDLVILNAGILPEIKDMKDTRLDEFKKVMDVNVWSNKVLLDYLSSHIPAIRQVVAISSGASVNGNRGWNAYSMSKAALNMLVKLYSAETPETHFCALAPGIIDTPMQDYISGLPDDDKYPTLKKLKDAKGTSKMPGPEESSGLLRKAFDHVMEYESGAFVDVRDLYFR
jgi:NAD(P)-dependent dehydrogenase (short-subunit alcohol dehydrogenase family)